MGDDSYNFQKRFDQWKKGFEQACEANISAVMEKYPQQDIFAIPVENAEFKLKEIRQKIEAYPTNHKTQDFVAIMETINELFFGLDKVDVEYLERLKDRRKNIYEQLNLARGQLERKLHKDVDNCGECQKVRMRTK